MTMSLLTTSSINAVIVAIAAATVYELWKQRSRLLADELDEEMRRLAWRVSMFLVMPFVVWIDLRSTLVASDYFGGWVKDWTYGILWFSAEPQNLSHSDLLLPTLFFGVAVQLLLLISVLPALFFRPHPFLASIVSYSALLVLTVNLIIDPLAGLLGLGNSRWQIAFSSLGKEELSYLLCFYALAATSFMLLVGNRTFRIWLAELTNPVLAEELRIAISESRCDRENQYQSCRLAILFEKVGMRSHAGKELAHLKKIAAGSIYLPLAEGYIYYRKRKFKKARQAFEQASSFAHIQDVLRSIFLSAAACSAYGEGDSNLAINLSERALEFDENAMLARMVKVDAYLKQGKKEQAGQEVLAVLKNGAEFDSEEMIPLDAELALRLAFRFQKDARAKEAAAQSQKSEAASKVLN